MVCFLIQEGDLFFLYDTKGHLKVFSFPDPELFLLPFFLLVVSLSPFPEYFSNLSRRLLDTLTALAFSLITVEQKSNAVQVRISEAVFPPPP